MGHTFALHRPTVRTPYVKLGALVVTAGILASGWLLGGWAGPLAVQGVLGLLAFLRLQFGGDPKALAVHGNLLFGLATALVPVYGPYVEVSNLILGWLEHRGYRIA